MSDSFSVLCASGTLRPGADGSATHFAHRWTDGGVDVVADFTGAHLLHASVAACILNDLYREAASLGLRLDGVRVEAEGGFDETWGSTGITYRVELDSPADSASRDELLLTVDRVAEIPGHCGRERPSPEPPDGDREPISGSPGIGAPP